MDTINTELIRGHVDTIILNVLQEKDRYGYEILELISNSSHGRYEIKQPTLYSCLKRLEKQGFISSYYGDESNGGRRRYYKLDTKGVETLTKDQREWEYSRTIIDKLLSDKQVDLKTVEAPFDATDLRPLTKRVKAYDVTDKSQDDKIVERIVEKQIVYQPVYIEVPANAATSAINNSMVPANAAASVINNSTVPTDMPMEYKNPTPEQLRAESVLYAKPTVLDSSVDSANNNLKEVITQNYELPSYNTNISQPIPRQTSEELAEIEQRMINASKQLNIGNFNHDAPQISKDSQIFIGNKDNSTMAETALFKTNMPDTIIIPSDTNEHRAIKENSVNYREVFAALYSKKNDVPTVAEEKEALLIDSTPTKAKQFADMKQSLLEEGYKLKQYSKANSTNFYYMNYFYCNKIARDTSLIAYLAFVVELLLIFIGKKAFGYSGTALLIIGVVAAIIPGIFTAKWITNPTKRIKADFNFNTILINSCIVFIIIVAITTIINMVSPTIGIDFTSGKMYVPYILAINIPLGIVMYNTLYRTKNYHLK